LKASQSLLVSQGGVIAWLNGWTNGCISVELKSFFSYQVAAGNTISENNPELVIRKSILINKSTLPSAGVSFKLIFFGCHEFFVSVKIESSPPIMCFTKYSCPLPLSPSKFERQLKNTLGKVRSSSGFSIAQLNSPSASCLAISLIASASSRFRFLASLITSKLFSVSCGYPGSHPNLTDNALKSAGCILLNFP